MADKRNDEEKRVLELAKELFPNESEELILKFWNKFKAQSPGLTPELLYEMMKTAKADPKLFMAKAGLGEQAPADPAQLAAMKGMLR